MCIAYIDFQPNQPYPLRIAANRDEFHQRPAQTAHYWPDHSGLLAGRDLKAGGSWLGIHPTKQRFALVTNFREPGHPAPTDAISRGRLVQDFLIGDQAAKEYLLAIAQDSHRYAGFNLIVGERLTHNNAALWYYSNRAADGPKQLPAGRYALSNHLLNTPWPKTKRLSKLMIDALAQDTLTQQLRSSLQVLRDDTQAPNSELPNTGISHELEKNLSSVFIIGPEYGSRCSTVILISASGKGIFCEQSYDPNGQPRERIDWPLQLRPNN